MRRASTEVLVVGSGVAGLSSAAAALSAGAKVTVLERSTAEESGGQTRWTEALLRMKSADEVSDDFSEHFMQNAGHYLDPELIREVSGSYEGRSQVTKSLAFTDPDVIGALADNAGPTIRWLEGFGVRFDFLPTYFLTACQPRMAPVGGGLAIITSLQKWIVDQGAEILFETSAHDLLLDEDGEIGGVVARDAAGTLRIEAKKVILACGGFEGNPEMLSRYIGPKAAYVRPVARGGYHNKGEGIRMALRVGAAPCGDFGSFHAEPLDPRSGAPEPVVLVFNYGILVNLNGKRFVDEAPATVDATYEAITRTILDQPRGIAYLILDSAIEDVPTWRRAVRSDQEPIQAPTLAALARQIGIDPDAVEETVRNYNDACPAPGPFRPLELDGLATSPVLVPRKSNWSRPIGKPPYLAFPIMCGNCFTFGGLKTDELARVLDGNGNVINNLYAAGETMGLYYGTYTGATSVLRGAVFGRIAGKHAAEVH